MNWALNPMAFLPRSTRRPRPEIADRGRLAVRHAEEEIGGSTLAGMTASRRARRNCYLLQPFDNGYTTHGGPVPARNHLIGW